MKTVTITIAPDGSIKSEVSGVVGKGCQDIDKAILAALGKVGKETKTPDYFKPVSQQQRAGR
jgi:hypothetical protein